MKIKLKLLFVIYVFILFDISASALENKIILRVNNEIITSIDIFNEIKYLTTLNPGINKLKEIEVYEISKKSLIKEKIKENEIQKNFANTSFSEDFLKQLIINVYTKIGIGSLDEFKIYLMNNQVKYETVVDKIKTEALWNELIVTKFSKNIKINKNQLKEEIKENQIVKQFLMSEIFFEIENIKDFEKKNKEINESIKKIGFENAALKYSISQTSNMGGKLDWISENSMNKNIKKIVNKTKINEVTKPLPVAGGYLILKINDIKTVEAKLNFDQELKKMIRSAKNNQLNQFSIIYFNKIKKDIRINES
jgi:peptidyl-prolyl cis-trans isomerase SurA